MPTVTQYSLFTPETPAAIPTTRKRCYARHERKHVRWLQMNYRVYTQKEAAAALGLSLYQLRYLVRTHQIKKRAPNGQRWCGKPRKESAHIPALGVAA